jgi:hypothetical protein
LVDFGHQQPAPTGRDRRPSSEAVGSLRKSADTIDIT